jgi:putative addiction module component (TIGR02574 family)
MRIAAQKIAEVLALPEQDRAFLAHKLIASLDNVVDADAEAQWQEVIDRRSGEMDEGRVDARSEEEIIQDIQAKLNAARRQAS